MTTPGTAGDSTPVDKHTFTFTDGNFDREVLRAEGPVLVDFWAAWCSSCRLLGPTIDQLAEEYAGIIKVGNLDTDANKEISARYGISSVPAVFLFVNGETHEKFVGLRSKSEYQAVLDKLVCLRRGGCRQIRARIRGT